MNARIRKMWNDLGEAFWLVPALMVVAAILAAQALLHIDRSASLPTWLADSGWLYNGGGTGARTLLGAIASSAIGVAGTVFSITIAALSLAAGQMGPRLLRNFTRDRGNQVTLGAFLGTYSYALMVLRSVRTQAEGAFTPHLSLTVGLVLAFGCVATLVYFVGHMASRINVDTVVELVNGDIRAAFCNLTTDQPQAEWPDDTFWANAIAIADDRQGYLQQLDEEALADWVAKNGVAVRLLVRRGDYVFPGSPVALVTANVTGVLDAIQRATALAPIRGRSGDADHAVRQLVEVAVRALSPGINDPHTAISVLDRLGAVLSGLSGKCLPTGVHLRGDAIALAAPNLACPGLTDLMFHMIRQNAMGSPAVMIHLLHVLTEVAAAEPDPARQAQLRRHADLVWSDVQSGIANAADLMDVRKRWTTFHRVLTHGASAILGLPGERSFHDI